MRTLCYLYLILFLCLATCGSAQELLVGGNMESESSWKVSHLDSQDTTLYEFNYLDVKPTYGSGGCLHAVCSEIINGTNIAFYQPVVLTGGEQYEVKGGFGDIAGTIANFWCELLYDTLEPPAKGDISGTIIVGFNTWDQTPPGIDGTFQDDYDKGDGPVFTAPGEIGVPDTVYFVLNIGVYAGGTVRSFDVVVDELSLSPIGTSVGDDRAGTVNQFALYQNHPNPFNPLTTIAYSLAQGSTVTLKVYDALGREISTLIDRTLQTAGRHEVSFNAENLPSGIFFYQLQADRLVETRKMILIK